VDYHFKPQLLPRIQG